MNKRLSSIILFATLLFIASNILAEVTGELSVGGGYQDNLFNDSNAVDDRYASFGAGLKYYPSASAQIAVRGNYNAFSTISDLSNFSGEVSAIVIPTPDSSNLSLALAGRVTARKFGTAYELYDYFGGNAEASLNYRLSQRIHALASVSYLNNSYTNSDYGSNSGVYLSAGLNLTVLGSNSLAVRFDYMTQSFNQQVTSLEGNGNNNNLTYTDKSETFDIAGLTLRLSRPLGKRTGLNLSAGYRQLLIENDFSVPGYTIDYLSPWADLWEGASISGNIKHFFPHQIIGEISAAYYDKEFAEVIELSGDEYWTDKRSDRMTDLSIKISRPFGLQNGGQLRPSLNINYRLNESTSDYFDYDSFQASLFLNWTM